jgi:hypothetical protein
MQAEENYFVLGKIEVVEMRKQKVGRGTGECGTWSRRKQNLSGVVLETWLYR